MCAPKAAPSSTEHCRTDHPLPPPSPNTKYQIHSWVGGLFLAVMPFLRSPKLFFSPPLSSGLETSNKICESAVCSHHFGFLLWFSVCPFSGKKKRKKKTSLGWNQRRVCPWVQHTAPARWLCAISALAGSAVMLCFFYVHKVMDGSERAGAGLPL